MSKQPKNVKFFRDRLEKAHHVKIINIIVALDENNRLIHSHMEHPHPITRPILMNVLQGLREQVVQDYKELEKSASNLKTAEMVLSIVSEPAHDSKPNIGSEPDIRSIPTVGSEPTELNKSM